jgi:hypothetical protein
MRALATISVWLALTGGAGLGTATAQSAAAAPASTGPARPRVRISANAGVQPSSIAITSSTTKPIYAENETVATTYSVGSGAFFDGGLLVRLAGGLHAGVTVSSFMKQNDGDVASTVPHPFFYNTPRQVSGVAGGLERSELVTHLQAAYVIQAGKSIDIAVSVGPSWFHVTQDLVTGITFTERYPYDTATFAAASTAAASADNVGVNAGVDVGIKLSKNVGIGGLVRYSHTSVEFPLSGATSPKSDAGGFQGGGGIRLYF